MKILFISSDRNLFKDGSDAWNRYLDYGKLFEEIHVIVFSHKNLSNKNIKIGDNVFIYPTNHICKFFYLWSIYKISKQLLSAEYNNESAWKGAISKLLDNQDLAKMLSENAKISLKKFSWHKLIEESISYFKKQFKTLDPKP